MSQITQKMGYVSLFGENSLFETEAIQADIIKTNSQSKKAKIHYEVHLIHNSQDAFEVLRERPKSNNRLYLYASQKNDKKVKDLKVTKFNFSGLRFYDIEPIGVTASVNILKDLMKDKSLAKDIVNDLADWLNINNGKYELEKSDIVFMLEAHLQSYVQYLRSKDKEEPNAIELIIQIFLLCIKLGVIDLSNTAGYISEQVLGAIADYIRSFKFGQEAWNPNIANIQYKDIPYENLKYNPPFLRKFTMSKAFVDTMDKLLIQDISKLNIPKHDATPKEIEIGDAIIKGITGSIDDIIIWFKNTIRSALNDIGGAVQNIARLMNAFMVGFINGLIELLASIVDGIGGLIGLLNYQNQVAISKGLDKFLSEVSWSKIGEIISDYLADLFSFLIGDEPYKNAYELGGFIPRIFEIALEIIGLAKGVGRVANKFPKAKQFINDNLDNLINRIKLPGIDRKALAELKKKNITVEVQLKTVKTLNSGPIKVKEKDKIIIKYKNSILKEVVVKADLDQARRQNDGINDYIRRLNEDPAYLNSEYIRVHRRRLRKTKEFKKTDQWLIDRRDEYMKDGLVNKKITENGVTRIIQVKGRVIDVEKIKALWKSDSKIQKAELKGDDLDKLTEIKNSRTDLENENIVKVNAKFEMDGQIVEYEYIEHSGKGIRYDGAKGVPMGRRIKDNEFFDTIYEVNRKSDSESKVMELIKEDHTDLLQVAKKPKSVKLLSLDLKTTYDPCIVCKKELILFNRFFNADIRISRPFYTTKTGKRKVVTNNKNFKKINKL